MELEMTKSDFILAAMAGAHECAAFDPVRIQKLIFLIETQAASFINGPHFDFKPYHYGPFDKSVFRELDRLHAQGKVELLGAAERRYYALTSLGREHGTTVLNTFSESLSDFFQKCPRWVLSMSFRDLLGAIYEKYPEMAVHSVASDLVARRPSKAQVSPAPDFLSGIARSLDLAGVYDDFPVENEPQSDLEMIREDWAVVGDDLRRAMAGF